MPQKQSAWSLQSTWRWLNLLHYRFEVTYAPYVLDPYERFFFYTFVLLILLAILAMTFYPTRYMWRLLVKTPLLGYRGLEGAASLLRGGLRDAHVQAGPSAAWCSPFENVCGPSGGNGSLAAC